MIWLVIASLIWGVSFGLIGSNLTSLPSSYVASVRLALCFLIFLPFIRRLELKVAFGMMCIGAVQFGLMYLTYIKSFSYMKSYEVALFTTLTPIYVTLIYDLFKIRISWRQLGAAVLAVAGAAIILWKEGGIGNKSFGTGFLILQVSNICFAAGQLAYARWKGAFAKTSEKNAFAWMYMGALIVLLAFTGVEHWKTGLAATSTKQWYVLIYLGVVASGITFFIWNHGARRVSPGRLAVMNNLKIPLAAVCSIFIFKEQSSFITLAIGFGFLLLSIFISRNHEA